MWVQRGWKQILIKQYVLNVPLCFELKSGTAGRARGATRPHTVYRPCGHGRLFRGSGGESALIRSSIFLQLCIVSCLTIQASRENPLACVSFIQLPPHHRRDLISAQVGRGVLTTASYEARSYGARSGMPGVSSLVHPDRSNLADAPSGFIAKKLCPQLVLLPIRGARYSEMSRFFSSFHFHQLVIYY